MSDFENIRIYRARKSHICWLCNKEICSGEEYTARASKFEGDFSYLKFHNNCFSIVNDCMFDYSHTNGDFILDRRAIIDWFIDNKCSACKKNNFKCIKCSGFFSFLLCKYRSKSNICDLYSCHYVDGDICYGEDFIK